MLLFSIEKEFSANNRTVCPSGLRGWTQVPLAQAAWAQIPQLSLLARTPPPTRLRLSRTWPPFIKQVAGQAAQQLAGPRLCKARLGMTTQPHSRGAMSLFRASSRHSHGVPMAVPTYKSMHGASLLVCDEMATCKDSLPEWSKGVDSSSTSVV